MYSFKDLIEDLEVTVLSNHPISGELDNNNRVIDHTSYNKVGRWCNLALQALHTRFPLRTGEVIVQQVEGISIYNLTSDYAVMNLTSTQPHKYIKDSPSNPFLDDILKIEQIFNENGELLPLNIAGNPKSIFIMSPNVIQTSQDDNSNAMAILYRQKHPTIAVTAVSNLENIPIFLPDAFKLALHYYIADKAYENIQVNKQTQDSYEYNRKYEMECQILTNQGMIDPEVSSGSYFDNSGWV